MNIRVFLSKVAGSKEEDIEYIERCVTKNQPFGLGCHRSKILFIPATFKAYWLWSDNSAGPVFTSKGLSEFVDTVKMQYLTHKELITTDGVLAITCLLDYDRTKRQVAAIRHANVPEPREQARPLETGDGRIQTGGID